MCYRSTQPWPEPKPTNLTDAEDFYKLNDLALLAQIALGDPRAEPLRHRQYLIKVRALVGCFGWDRL